MEDLWGIFALERDQLYCPEKEASSRFHHQADCMLSLHLVESSLCTNKVEMVVVFATESDGGGGPDLHSSVWGPGGGVPTLGKGYTAHGLDLWLRSFFKVFTIFSSPFLLFFSSIPRIKSWLL